MAEQLGLDQFLGNRGAIDLDERALHAPAVVVDGVGDELFAGAVFALDQDVGFGIGDGGHQVEQLTHLAAAPDDVLELVAVQQLPAQREVFGLELGSLDRATQHRQHALGVDRLFEKVGGAGLDGLHRARDAALPADDQHFRPRLQRLEPSHQVGAVDVGQHQVNQRRIRLPTREQRLGIRPARGDTYVVPGAGERQRQPLRHIRLVVDDEHAPHAFAVHGHVTFTPDRMAEVGGTPRL